MEDFKIIFYIAIAIAWAVYKNYQKVQKNRPVTNLPPQTQQEIIIPGNEPVEMVSKKYQKENKSSFGKQEKIKNEFKPDKVEQRQKPVLFSDRNLEAAAAISASRAETIQKGSEEKKQIKINTIAEEFTEEGLLDLKKFDIRTAIIYSEILKRPYV